MCAGVAKIEKENCEVEGFKTDLLDYSNRTIKIIKAYQDLFKQHIKELKEKYEGMDDHDWMQHLNKEKIYRSELLVKRNFFGEKSEFLSEIGMYTYSNLHDYQDKNKLITWLKNIYKQTQHIENLPTRPESDTVNCLDYENPYLKRYGFHWEKELKKLIYEKIYVHNGYMRLCI